MAYRVTAPLVIVRDAAGVMHHVYQDGVLPENADAEHLKQLLSDKMVEKFKPAEPAPADAADNKPAGNADRTTWAEYARGKGATDEELKEPADGGLSRDELRDKYGK
jgi:hypothetical protein